MSNATETYNTIKAKVERLRTAKAQAEGALAEQMKRLKDEFDVDTIPEARELSVKYNQEADASREAFETALADFQTEYGDIL